jgi:hypothetical protein
MEENKKLIKQINELRKQIREHYELVGKSLYLITFELDNYLDYLSKGLNKEEVPKPE